MDTNNCGGCGHNWVPRTMVVSSRCPNCRSTDVSLERDYGELFNKVAVTSLGVVVIGAAMPMVLVGGVLLMGVWMGAQVAWHTVTQ